MTVADATLSLSETRLSPARGPSGRFGLFEADGNAARQRECGGPRDAPARAGFRVARRPADALLPYLTRCRWISDTPRRMPSLRILGPLRLEGRPRCRRLIRRACVGGRPRGGPLSWLAPVFEAAGGGDLEVT